jgi:hypothetical protein
MEPVLNDDDCIEFGPRQSACKGWPVRVSYQQGLWRYAAVIDDDHVEVIGPYFPGNPSRNGGRSRIFHLSKLKYAGKSAKPLDVLDVQATAISNDAKRARRR